VLRVSFPAHLAQWDLLQTHCWGEPGLEELGSPPLKRLVGAGDLGWGLGWEAHD
jgi:hypothetical protein